MGTAGETAGETAGFGWRATIGLLRRLPQGALSRVTGRLADIPIARSLRRPVLGGFARLAGIDVTEAEHPLEAYETLNRFFVRRLRPGVRSWPESGLVSPVDALLGQCGTMCRGTLFQAKGRTYSAGALLGDDADAEPFEGGAYITFYLSPRHYHRIHTPCPGRIHRARHLPGRLLPVNAAAVLTVPHVFPRNERLVCFVESDAGRVAIVAIGATNVGRISAAFDADWCAPDTGAVTNRPRAGPETRDYAPPRNVAAGDELMAFHVGSSVVMLMQRDRGPLRGDLRPGGEVRVGEPLVPSRL